MERERERPKERVESWRVMERVREGEGERGGERGGEGERVVVTLLLQELCQRREEVVRRHQKALTKVQTAVGYKERMESHGHHVVSHVTELHEVGGTVSLPLHLPAYSRQKRITVSFG